MGITWLRMEGERSIEERKLSLHRVARDVYGLVEGGGQVYYDSDDEKGEEIALRFNGVGARGDEPVLIFVVVGKHCNGQVREYNIEEYTDRFVYGQRFKSFEESRGGTSKFIIRWERKEDSGSRRDVA